MAKSTLHQVFVTEIYEAALGGRRDLREELEESCHQISQLDKAGRQWCQDHAYPGYTSYASLDDLPLRDPAFAELEKRLDRHISRFAESSAFDLGRRRLSLDSLWINILDPGGVHSGHIHPHSVVSGTYYVTVPEGGSALKFEDPRLPMMMIAPQRGPAARADQRPFHYVRPRPGRVLLWESWLRHEVVRNQARQPRISISFNYGWQLLAE